MDMRDASIRWTGAADAVDPGSSREGATAGGRRRHWGGPVVGGFYLSMGGVHLGLVAADPEKPIDTLPTPDSSLRPRRLAGDLNDQSAVFGQLLMVGETALGILLLLGGRFATVGWAGVIAFHVLLMLFGFGVWLWCLPALAGLVYLARKDKTSAWSKGGHSSQVHGQVDCRCAGIAVI